MALSRVKEINKMHLLSDIEERCLITALEVKEFYENIEFEGMQLSFDFEI